MGKILRLERFLINKFVYIGLENIAFFLSTETLLYLSPSPGPQFCTPDSGKLYVGNFYTKGHR